MTSMETDFYTFLRQHGVDDQSITNLQANKIDSTVAKLMEDEDLKPYLLHYGHRVLARNFSNNYKPEKHTRKSKLLETLRKKLEAKRHPDDIEDEGSCSFPKKKSLSKLKAKEVRNIEMGWLMYDDEVEAYKQVRQKKGGGTRKLSVKTSAQKDELLRLGKELFFPTGHTSENLDFDLMDFKEVPIDGNVTVEELYECTKVNRLRFYVATKKNKNNCEILSDDYVNSNVINPVEETVISSETEHVGATPLKTIHEEVMLPDATEVNESLNINGYLQHNSIYDNYGMPFDSSDVIEVEVDVTEVEEAQLSACATNSRVVYIHHGNTFLELIQEFQDPTILLYDLSIQRVLPSGETEKAVDMGGVTRDVLTQFWNDFCENCTFGKDQKVPTLRHDFDEGKWKSTARILCFGWKIVNYWPIQISKALFEYCLFGEVKCDLVSILLHYVSESDSYILQSALGDFKSVDLDDLLDVLQHLNGKKLPTAENFHQMLAEISHKEIIQEPMFVIECWREILLKNVTLNALELSDVYKNLEPSVKKILQLLLFPVDMNIEEQTVAHYLKKYIRELDRNKMGMFLRFCTGSDLLTVAKIEVIFRNVSGFSRSPIAHTCGQILEIPSTYNNFQELRSEFNSIMNSGVWVMDMV